MNIFEKSKIQASDLYAQAYKFVSEKFEQAGKVFSVSSAYGQILSVISNLSSMILFFIEDSITELNMLTASRTQSIQGLARLAGHNATRAVAATGEISFKVSSIPISIGNVIIIPNYTRIKCENNGKTYILNMIDDQLRIDVNSGKTYSCQVVQGEIFTQIFTGDGSPLQSFVAVTKGSVLIDNFFVNVFVNGEKWRKYDSLYDIPRNGKGYLVKTGITGGIDIYFGNTNFGMAPPAGSEIRVEYLQTSGNSGNIREGEDVTFTWIDSGYSQVGEELNLNDVLSTSMSKIITFGSNPEPTALTRLIAPKTSRSFVFANPENYIIFLEKFNYFSVVDAYTTKDDSYIDDDNVIYLFLVPDITKRLQDSENYFTVPLKYFSLTSQEREKVLETIEKSGSSIVTTVVKIVEPTVTKYVLNISLVIFEGYSQDVIRNSIIEKLSEYFLTMRRRDLVPSSDLVKIIESVEGVDSVNVSFLGELNENSKKSDPNADLVGLDEMGDIVIQEDALALIRGGWSDRNGVYYEDGIYTDRPCSVNISVKRVTKNSLNSQMFQANMKNIVSK